MDTFADLIAAVQTELNLTNNSSFPRPDKIKYALNNTYIVFGSLHRWSKLDDAKKTASIDCTTDGEQYYDYPKNWYPDSIWRLEKDGQDYGDPIQFRDFLYEIKNKYPDGDRYLWANQWDRFFIAGTSSASETNDISIWGSKVVEELTNPDDLTIFSFNMREVNVAIVDESCARLKLSGQDIASTSVSGIGDLYSGKAQQTLNVILKRMRMEKMKTESTRPAFQVGDMFRRGGATPRGGKHRW